MEGTVLSVPRLIPGESDRAFPKKTGSKARARRKRFPAAALKLEANPLVPLSHPADHASSGEVQGLRSILRGNDRHHADAHVEDLIHLLRVDLPATLDVLKERGHLP